MSRVSLLYVLRNHVTGNLTGDNNSYFYWSASGINLGSFALCFINDLPSVVNCMLDLYVDDAELHCSHLDLHVVETCLQCDLDSVAT